MATISARLPRTSRWARPMSRAVMLSSLRLRMKPATHLAWVSLMPVLPISVWNRNVLGTTIRMMNVHAFSTVDGFSVAHGRRVGPVARVPCFGQLDAVEHQRQAGQQPAPLRRGLLQRRRQDRVGLDALDQPEQPSADRMGAGQASTTAYSGLPSGPCVSGGCIANRISTICAYRSIADQSVAMSSSSGSPGVDARRHHQHEPLQQAVVRQAADQLADLGWLDMADRHGRPVLDEHRAAEHAIDPARRRRRTAPACAPGRR